MKKYNSYTEAKIDNPDCEVYKFLPRIITGDGHYFASNNDLNGAAIVNGSIFKCNPADHCMTLEQFFDDGHKLVDGDVYLGGCDNVCVVGLDIVASGANTRHRNDNKRYILRAKSLETKLKPEWANGDECEHGHRNYSGANKMTYIGAHPFVSEKHVCLSELKGLVIVDSTWLRKPESPTEKAKREALSLFDPHGFPARQAVEIVIDRISKAGMLKSKDEK